MEIAQRSATVDPAREELERRLADVERRLDAAGEEPAAALLEERLALVVALAELEAGGEATDADEAVEAARERIERIYHQRLLRETERKASAASGRQRSERERKKRRKSAGALEELLVEEGRAGSKAPSGCSPMDPLCGLVSPPGTGAKDGWPSAPAPPLEGADEEEDAGGVRGATVRRSGPPAGVLRAVRDRSQRLAECLESRPAAEALRLRVEARIDPAGVLRDPRLGGAPLDGATGDCLTDALRGLRVGGSGGSSRLVAFDLVIGGE